MIDLEQEVLQLDGEPIPDLAQVPEPDENGDIDLNGVPPLTLRKVIARALVNAGQRKEVPTEKKLNRGTLALKVFDHEGPMTLKAEDVSTIKECVGEVYGPLVVARTFPMLDPAEGEDGE